MNLQDTMEGKSEVREITGRVEEGSMDSTDIWTNSSNRQDREKAVDEKAVNQGLPSGEAKLLPLHHGPKPMGFFWLVIWPRFTLFVLVWVTLRLLWVLPRLLVLGCLSIKRTGLGA